MEPIFSTHLDSTGEPLFEMANAIQKYTGLPGVVYFSTQAEAKGKKPLGRVKWLVQGQSVFISIKPDKDGKRKCGGDPKLVKQLEAFVILNQDLLWEYWNTAPDKADSASILQQFKQV